MMSSVVTGQFVQLSKSLRLAEESDDTSVMMPRLEAALSQNEVFSCAERLIYRKSQNVTINTTRI